MASKRSRIELRDFEIEAIGLLVGSTLSNEELVQVLDEGSVTELKETGYGYFLTLAHPGLSQERLVCDKPVVSGRHDHLRCGFVVFIEDRELTLECYPLFGDPLPNGFRLQPVEIY